MLILLLIVNSLLVLGLFDKKFVFLNIAYLYQFNDLLCLFPKPSKGVGTIKSNAGRSDSD